MICPIALLYFPHRNEIKSSKVKMDKTHDLTTKKFSGDKLRQLLRDYLRVTDGSAMAEIVEKIIKAYLSDKPLLLLSTPESLPWNYVQHSLEALGISFFPKKIKAKESDQGFDEEVSRSLREVASEQGGRSELLHVTMVSLEKRYADYELLVPFFFQKNLTELGRTNELDTLRIDVLLLPLFDHLLSSLERPSVDALDNLIREAVNLAQDGSISSEKFAWYNRIDWKDLIPKLRELGDAALMYLGLKLKPAYPGRTTSRRKHPIIEVESERLYPHLANRPSYHRYGRYLSFEKHVAFTIDNIGVAVRNYYHLKLIPKEEKLLLEIRETLAGRLRNEKEKEICLKRGFTRRSDYNSWLTKNHIDITTEKPCKVYEDWLQARKELGLDQKGGRKDTRSNLHVLSDESDDAGGLENGSLAEFEHEGAKLECKSNGRIILCRHGELDFTRPQGKINEVYYRNYMGSNDYIPEIDAFKEAKLIESSFKDMFKSRHENFRILYERHPKQPDLWRFKPDL